MKYTVETEEITNILTLSKEKTWGCDEFEIPDELAERFHAAWAEFFAVQKALREHTGITRDYD